MFYLIIIGLATAIGYATGAWLTGLIVGLAICLGWMLIVGGVVMGIFAKALKDDSRWTMTPRTGNRRGRRF